MMNSMNAAAGQLATAIAIVAALSRPIGAQPAQLTIASATPDPSGQTITIVGANFGRRPLVTLELIPLTVQVAVESQILAAAPVGEMSPGTYLLTVSRGPSPEENASLPLILGSPAAKNPPAAASPAAASMPGSAEPAATVGDRTITIADVDAEWQRSDPGGFIASSRNVYDTRRRILDKMVADELIGREAAARGLSPDALLDQELPKRTVPLPDSAALSVYQSLGDLTRGATLEQMLPSLRAWLQRNIQPELAKMRFVEELMKVSTRAEVTLAPPRVQVRTGPDEVGRGPQTAPVVLVVFGDFESVQYTRFAQAFGRVLETFADTVRLVFKHLPTLSPQSRVDAEAAACAHAQGKFWPYHDVLVAESGRFEVSRLQELASTAGIDRRTFDACLDAGTFRAALDQSVIEAEQYGIRESPGVLVNGALAPPPPVFLPPFEYFKRLIEEEMQRVSRARLAR
jgi:protein-disulfide isomerase